MQDALKSIYLRLDVNMQYLASKAIAQIIIKIVYANGGPMSAGEIKKELAKANDGKSFDDYEINGILKDLCPKELKNRDGRYYLSTNRMKKLQDSLKESEDRQNNVLDKYFNGLNSDRESLRNWLTIITLAFFETYSNEWISDLKANTHHVTQSADSIRTQVTRRTDSIKNLDKDDKAVLPSRFFEFVNSHDPEVEAYLWGYGTSAFASKLLCNKYGVDKLTMSAFKDSVCVFDTNVLLFIALENKYAGSFKALEKVFIDLNVQPKYLYITKNEYNNKIANQRDLTLSNFDKYGKETISQSKDDFTSLAVRLGCKSRQDYERFFDHTISLPNLLYDRVEIQLMDDDKTLIDAIDKAQADEQLKSKLSGLYQAVVGKEKSPTACHHDIGLLEGVRYLRNNSEGKKFFILSDEISVNQYSKGLGTKNDLPLALRVDTLINLLAVNNGGDTFDASDYKPLFANIIRMGLIPHKDTFDQLELYQLAQMNVKIMSLPTTQVCDIATEMHRNMMDGMSEQDLARELNKLITRGELTVRDELSVIKEELTESGKQNKHLIDSLNKAESAVEEQVARDYDKTTKMRIALWWVGIIVFVLFVACVIVYLVNSNDASNDNLQTSIIVGIISSAIVSFVGGIIAKRRVIANRKQKRDKFIYEETNRRLKR